MDEGATPRFAEPCESGRLVARRTRDSLLAELVSWLRQQQVHAISSMQPDPALFGSLSTAIPKVVADAEVELERAFQIRLRFTENGGAC